MKWFRKLIGKYYLWKLHKKYKHLQLSPQGQYCIKYIIDYYINETTNEQIDRYEQQITELSSRIKLPNTSVPIPDTLKPSLLHFHAAIMMLKAFLMISPNKQEWLEHIEDEEIRAMIARPICIN